VLTPEVPERHAFLVLYLCLSVFICGSISPLLGQAPAKAPPAHEKIDLLVAGGTVVTMDAERRVVEDGAVAVRSDTIVAVGPASSWRRGLWPKGA